MNQYDEGMNDKSYNHQVREANDNIRKENEVIGLIACY